MLSKTLQRYENKSKSQLTPLEAKHLIGCLRLCKDTKIKANHNYASVAGDPLGLSKTLQRYENKSKSQRRTRYSHFESCCLRLCKDTKIKANHNVLGAIASIIGLSKTLQRYENKSKSQQLNTIIVHNLVV